MRSFLEAKNSLPDGHVVAAGYDRKGRPFYFHVPVDAPDDVVRGLAFEAREGRPMTDYESALLVEAERRHDGGA